MSYLSFKKGTYKHRMCAICGERVFLGRNGQGKYCSDKCRRKAYNEYHRIWAKAKNKRMRDAGICPCCGQRLANDCERPILPPPCDPPVPVD